MTIRPYRSSDFEALVDFNTKHYPKRQSLRESLRFRVDEHPKAAEGHASLLAFNADGHIVGQMLLMPTDMHYKGEADISHCAMDFMVAPDYRGQKIGTKLCEATFVLHNHFSFGLNERSLPMHLKYGEVMLGQMTKYFRFTSAKSGMRFVFKEDTPELRVDFPNKIIGSNINFERVYRCNQLNLGKAYWSDDLLEFDRSIDYVSWRYFSRAQQHFVYRWEHEGEQDSFFVLKPTIWKGASCLLILDYRMTDKSVFSAILEASVLVAKQLNYAGLLLGSSLPSLQSTIRDHYFLPYGQQELLVGNNTSFQSDHEGDHVWLTFGDSDIEFYYGSNEW